MGKVITVWGSPNSGKSTISIKLGKEISKHNSVVVIFTDTVAPVIPIIQENIDNTKSLGNVLTGDITKDLILKNCIEVPHIKNLGFLGYRQGENIFSYPQYSESRVLELIEQLKNLVDYIIVDASSNIINDLISIVSLEVADTVFRVNSPELKNISYFDSFLPLLTDPKFKVDKQINILSNFRVEDSIDELADMYKVKETIPYMDEIREQNLCSELLLNLSSKEEKKLSSKLQNIISIINKTENIDVSKEEVIEVKKRGFFTRFRKGA